MVTLNNNWIELVSQLCKSVLPSIQKMEHFKHAIVLMLIIEMNHCLLHKVSDNFLLSTVLFQLYCSSSSAHPPSSFRTRGWMKYGEVVMLL